MTKEEFRQIFHEETDLDDELIDYLWETRPTDNLNANFLRQEIRKIEETYFPNGQIDYEKIIFDEEDGLYEWFFSNN